MATRTLLQICESVADGLYARVNGTLTAKASDGTTVTCASYPFKNGRTGASNKAYEGNEIYISGGTASAINPNGIASYVASTGVFTMSSPFTALPDATATFDIYLRGLSINDLKAAVNTAFRKIMYPTLAPLTLVVDGDMDSIATTSWTVANSDVTKVTDANALHGARALRVLNSSALGNVYGTIINVVAGESYYLYALARPAVGTGNLHLWDVTNNVSLGSVATETGLGWQWMGFQASIPATCKQVRVVLLGTGTLDDVYWDDVILQHAGASEMVLPTWINTQGQIDHIYRGYPWGTAQAWGEQPFSHEVKAFKYVTDLTNPNNIQRIILDSPATGPLWIQGRRYFEALTNYTDTVNLDDSAEGPWERLIVRMAQREVIDKMRNRGPSQDTLYWENRYSEWNRKAGIALANPMYGMSPTMDVAPMVNL